MDPDVAGKLLAQQADGVEHQDQRVQRVDARLRIGGSVGRLAFEGDADRRARDLLVGQVVVIRTGMHAKRRVHVFEESLADEAALCAAVLAAFFAGRSVDADLAAGFIDDLLQACGGQDGRRAEERSGISAFPFTAARPT